MHFSTLLGLAASIAGTQAISTGFNYGALQSDGSTPMVESDYAAQFSRAKTLQGTDGEFTSARLYTMIQGGTTDTPSDAFQAAMNTKTSLLLGLWCSAGQDIVTNEINAMKSAIQQYGSSFTSLVVGISVGSEDLYRVSPTGIENDSGAGATPDELVSYVKQVRSAISGTSLSGAAIGHVDTWTAWVNGSNSDVITAVDWLGMDTYPYFQTTDANGIDNAKELFFNAYHNTTAVSQGKDVWIAETGWPVSGKTSGQAVASIPNAETYWQEVACELLGNYNTWWYTLDDSIPSTPNPSFGLIAGQNLNGAPLYDLKCKATSQNSSSSTQTATGKGSHTTKPAGGKHGAGTSPNHGGPYGGSNSTGAMSTGAASTGGVGHPGSPMNGGSATASPGSPSSTASGAPFASQTGNSAVRANAAAGAGILAIFGLVLAL